MSLKSEGRAFMARIEPGPFYTVLDQDASDTDGPRYTVSRDPHQPGWNTDGGYLGYGLEKADAEAITWLLNNAHRLLA